MSAPTLSPGLTFERTVTVGEALLASAVGSGGIDVLATPAMIGLMEGAAAAAVQPHLDANQTTVGTYVDVRHLAATPPGLDVRVQATLVEVDGRRLVFRVDAFDPHERIGEGTHERMIVDPARLIARAQAKTGSSRG